MIKKNKMQKIIFGVILSFAFFVFVPTTVFALDGRESIPQTDKKAEQQRTVEAAAAAEENKDTVQLAGCPSGAEALVPFFWLNLNCVTSMLAIVANVVLKLSAFVLYIVGNLYDISIEIAVNSAQFIQELRIIEPTWAAIRDFLNMTFIFVLVYISWQILMGNTNYNVKNSVGRLVLVAILINFSLFAAKIMVDASNILALNIYEGIKAKGTGEKAARGSVSTRIMSTLGLPGIYNFSDAFNNKAIQGCGNASATILSVGVFGTILIAITAMTFLLTAILFFLRMLNIIVLFITSPIWVWGYVIQHPKAKEVSDKWWSNMMHVMKFPVMYMIIMYVSLAMFAQLNVSQKEQTGGKTSIIQLICNTATKEGKSVGVIDQLPIVLNFILVIAALIGAIKYSASEATKSSLGGKFGSSIANKFEGFSRKITTGAAQGLYNKAATAKGLATIGGFATGGLLGAGVGAAALYSGKKVGKATAVLAKDGVQLAGHKAKEYVAEKAGKLSLGDNIITRNSPKAQTAFAMLSNKFKDAKVFGETKKEASTRRTTPYAKREETLAKVQAEQTKIESEDVWKEKNKHNKKNKDEDYENYVNEKYKLIVKTQLGPLVNEVSNQKDANGNFISNSQFVGQAWETQKDDDGNVTGVKLNQNTLNKNIREVRKAHKKDGKLLKAARASRFGYVSKERAEARIEARDKVLISQTVGKVNSVEEKEKLITKLREQLETFPGDLNKAAGEASIKNFDRRVKEYFRKDTSEDKKDKLKEEIQEKRESIETRIEKLLIDIQKIKEKETSKKEETSKKT